MLLFDLVEEPDRVRTLLEDVENVRRAKMYQGMGNAAQEIQQAVKVQPWLRRTLVLGQGVKPGGALK